MILNNNTTKLFFKRENHVFGLISDFSVAERGQFKKKKKIIHLSRAGEKRYLLNHNRLYNSLESFQYKAYYKIVIQECSFEKRQEIFKYQ